MKNEMDISHMDEMQRHAWLRANRATLFVVGLAWTSLIVWELVHGRTPVFLLTMIPVFAALRFGFFHFYMRAGS